MEKLQIANELAVDIDEIKNLLSAIVNTKEPSTYGKEKFNSYRWMKIEAREWSGSDTVSRVGNMKNGEIISKLADAIKPILEEELINKEKELKNLFS